MPDAAPVEIAVLFLKFKEIPPYCCHYAVFSRFFQCRKRYRFKVFDTIIRYSLVLFAEYDIIALGDTVENLKQIVITKVESPRVVYSKKGKNFQTINRKAFGLSLCIDGQITYEMNGKRFVSTKENCVLLPQGATYTLTGEKDGLFPLINFRCIEPVCDEITVIPLRDPQACIDRFEILNRQYVNGASRFQIFSTFYQLLGEIFREQEAIPDVLASATEYIGQNLSRASLTNAEIAKASIISEVYLRKLFERYLNTSPRQYILKLRLRQAKHLLTNTSFTVTAVSEQCGFSSVYYFSRIFKRETGLTPTQYAQNNKIFKI